MSDFHAAMTISTSGLRAQSARLQRVSENIANVDTPGFRRKSIQFKAHENGGVKVGQTILDKAQLERVFDPSHPMSEPSGYYQGSNVNLIYEIADAREAQRSYEANLKLFDQTRQMASSLLDLLRN
tara:strand:- start:835 stop:1212 length:378 start_codon:yes stop_codon:yes gene_type:complete